MQVNGTYFQNDPQHPLVYGPVELINPPRRRRRGEPEKAGILCEPVIVGFCGTDHELMRMGAAAQLSGKFPPGQQRLINGHEGVVWVPEENRFAIVLIRGGDSYDPTRYTEDESYFEYGCDGADGLFADRIYVHPDMLLPIPEGLAQGERLPLSAAKKLVFPDPYACMLFQLERSADLGSAHLFRAVRAKKGCSEEEARQLAESEVFSRTVLFGLGTTGMFMGDAIRRSYPSSKIVFVARSEAEHPKVRFALEITGGTYVQSRFASDGELADAIREELAGRATLFVGASGSHKEHEIAFDQRVLGCNGVYNSFSLGPRISFDTMPFGFENHLIFGSINFRQDHMEQAIKLLAESRYDEIVSLIDKDEFTADPMGAYEQKIYAKESPMKTAVIWSPEHISFDE